jgi:geranylgeranyl reductase family protein
MPERRDVVVVGAGPAGAACALTLVERFGIDVLVLDRATFPRTKACAGGLSPGARESLEELGLWDGLVRRSQHIDTIRLESPSAIPVTFRGAAEGFVIPRRVLDAAAVERLKGLGGEVREGQRVRTIERRGERTRVSFNGTDVEARWVVVATGADWRRRVDGKDAPRIHSLMARYRGLDHDRHAIELQFTRELYPLYGWVFPEPGGVCNVGVGIEAHRMNGRTLPEVYREFVETRLEGRTDRAEMIGRPQGYPIMVSRWPRDVGRPGLVLAGEAARLVNPVTGEGISPALRSGILAGRAIASVLRDGADPEQSLARYRDALRRQVGPFLAVGEFLRTLGIRNLDWIIRYRRYLRGGTRILRFISRL